MARRLNRQRSVLIAALAAFVLLAAPGPIAAQTGCRITIEALGQYKLSIKTGGPVPVVEFVKGEGPRFNPLQRSGNPAECREELTGTIEVLASLQSEIVLFHVANELKGAALVQSPAPRSESPRNLPLEDQAFYNLRELAGAIRSDALGTGISTAIADVVKKLVKKFANPGDLLTDKGAKFVVDLAVQLMIEEFVEGRDPQLLIDALLARLVDHLKGHVETLAGNVGGLPLRQQLKPYLDQLAKEVKALITEEMPAEITVRAETSSSQCTWALVIAYTPQNGRYRALYSQECGPKADAISKVEIKVEKTYKPGEGGKVTARALNHLGVAFPLASATITGLAAVQPDGTGEPDAAIVGGTATFGFTVASPRKDQPYSIRVTLVTDKSVGALTGTASAVVLVDNVLPKIQSISVKEAGADPGELLELSGVRVLIVDQNADRQNHAEIPVSNVKVEHPNGLVTTPTLPPSIREVSFDGGSGHYVFELNWAGRIKRPHKHKKFTTPVMVADEAGNAPPSDLTLEVKDATPSVSFVRVEPQFVHSDDKRLIDITAKVEDRNGADDIVEYVIDATAAGGRRYSISDGLKEIGRGDEHIEFKIGSPFPHTEEAKRHPIPTQVRDEKNTADLESFLHVGNLAPISTGTGFVWDSSLAIEGPRDVCPNQPIRVGMIAHDPEGDLLVVTVTIVETGQRVELKQGSPRVYTREINAPGMPGTYTLLYEAREVPPRTKAVTPVRHILSVRVCEEPKKSVLYQLDGAGPVDEAVQKATVLRAKLSAIFGGTQVRQNVSPGSILRRILGGLFTPPASMSAYRGPSLAPGRRVLRPGDVLGALPRGGGASSQVSLRLVATGTSSGDFFRLQGLDDLGLREGDSISIPDGLVLQPLKGKVQQAVRTAIEKQLPVPGLALEAYCLDFVKLPPLPGQLYRVAEEKLQQQFAPVTRVLQAARRLTEKGALHPDSNPAGYAQSIKQWSLWARLEKWDTAAFEKEFVSYMKKNLTEANQPWSKAIEAQVRALVPNRWRDINAVWAAADSQDPIEP